jgi:predicted enzyme related to lactoylglutathione lyase
VVYYRVEDLAATYAAVVERGALSMEKPRKVHEDGTTSLHMAFGEDPDGNPVGMMEERPT